jgi:nucleoside phosphorylase
MYVVLAGTTGQGIALAAAMTAQIKYKCRHVNKIILVGIAAGQPNLTDKEKDVRLGDIVVSNRIIQYDHIKRTTKGEELRGETIAPADTVLMNVVDHLRTYQEFNENGMAQFPKPWVPYIEKGQETLQNAKRPDQSKDCNTNKRNYAQDGNCLRPVNEPFIHVGTIGSASTLLKDDEYRDGLNERYNTIAYEMEGAGVAIAAASSSIEYLMVRGICDYADMKKDDVWQKYASVCAAAFARAILEAQ